MLNVLIVDDERLNREELRRMLEEQDHFCVKGEAANGKEALKMLRNDTSFDVVFMDIEMPVMNGMEAARKLAEWPAPPMVVFVTAYNQYAIEAFEASAIDYLLKPLDPERFEKTIERIEQHAANRAGAKERLQALDEKTSVQPGETQKLVGYKRNSKDRIVIDPEEVYYFKAKYTEVTARLQAYELIVNSTLKEILTDLKARGFARTHKAYLVNLNRIEKISPMFSGNFEITLKPPFQEQKIPLSRRYAKDVKQRLHW